ncbi:hypothetical protein JQ543_18335 [Bradyrhizobium diazoefficiens]|nr:hypothetical protein [Bradyrhizobium diazoefficiens]MBR0849717.1 hypothetical protein [Bradyrhizobium diazoefficiens]
MFRSREKHVRKKPRHSRQKSGDGQDDFIALQDGLQQRSRRNDAASQSDRTAP